MAKKTVMSLDMIIEKAIDNAKKQYLIEDVVENLFEYNSPFRTAVTAMVKKQVAK